MNVGGCSFLDIAFWILMRSWGFVNYPPSLAIIDLTEAACE